MMTAASVAVLALLAGCGGGSGFDDSAKSDGLTSDSSKGLTVLIGSSGDTETEAVKKAVAAWSKKSGTKATVQVANDMAQQLSQGFAGGDPADVFYLAPEQLAGYASNGSLLAYGDELKNKSDFYDNLLQTFTYDGKLYAAPKDVSTLQLVINTDMWSAAGLTDADIPTTWDQLADVAKKLTTADHVGLAFNGEYARVGVFLKQAGGGLVSDDGTKAIASSDASVKGLEEVKTLLDSDTVKYASDLGTGWGGEAFVVGRGGGRALRPQEGCHDHRRQLDPRRPVRRLPGRQVQGRRAAGRPGRQGHHALHQRLGHRRRQQGSEGCCRSGRIPDQR